MSKVTRDDVAREAGTSVAVVSYVVNNGPRPVAAATRQRVLDAIEKLGYRPNSVAQALAAGSTSTIGLVVPDISNEFFAGLAFAVETAARKRGHTVLIANTEGDRRTERELVETLLGQQIDGIAVATADMSDLIPVLAGSGTRVVQLGPGPVDSPFVTVAVDDHGGAVLAAEHLAAHGYPEQAMIAGPLADAVADARLAGWRSVVGGAGRLVHVPFTVEDGYTAAIELLGSPTPPRAVFTASDRQAFGLLRAAADLGLRVPEDVAVASFDGSRFARYSVPQLTTVAQPVALMAEVAVDSLVGAAREPDSIVLDVELALGSSCGCGARPLDGRLR